MPRRTLRVAAMLAVVLAIPAFPALASDAPVGPVVASDVPAAGTALAPRWIIELAQPPLAQAPAGRPERAIASTGAAARLDLSGATAQGYVDTLAQQQQALFATLQATFPQAELQRQYQVVFNGLAVALPDAGADAAERLRALPGVVAVYEDRPYRLQADSALTAIGADALWNNPQIGGQGSAGAGVKIAIIDEGIALGSRFFDGTGYSYPEGFPKGDAASTNGKVIAARAYFRPDAPPLPSSAGPQPGPEDSSHGTHVAGTAAGNADTVVSVAGVEQTISGVAPRAYLMNYKAFYSNDTLFSGSAFSVELIAALEDAVRDGADVINNSWGSSPDEVPGVNPINLAAEAAADAGVVVVFAAGNEGPGPSTAGSPGYSDKLIAVAATTKAEAIVAGVVEAVAPDGVPESLRGRPYGAAEFGPQIGQEQVIGPSPYLPVGLACDPLPAGQLSGKIALIERGTCPFSVKTYNAQLGGATAAIIYNSEAGGEELIAMASGPNAELVRIPAVSTPRSVGLGLLSWREQQGDAALVSIDGRARLAQFTPDVLAGFSSRGPSFQSSLKPDLAAPGVNILSSGFAPGSGGEQHLGFGQSSGTSMASPHVAGAAALLRQLHPDWTTAEVKSALMSTASTEVWLDDARTTLAGVLERGAGRIDVNRAADPGLLFDRPSLSFGLLPVVAGQPTRSVLSVAARNVSGVAQTYTISGGSTGANPLGITVSPTVLTLGPGEQGSFTVAIEAAADAAAGDYEGVVELAGGPQPLHLPLWARTRPELAAKVLLLDNDGSSSLGLPDYSGYYGNLLVEQAIPFVYLDADTAAGGEQTLPPPTELARYELVLWFTGDNNVPSGATGVPTPLTEADQAALIVYLQEGGNLVASGQSLAEASDLTGPGDDPRFGRSLLYGGYLGPQFVHEDVFAGIVGTSRIVAGTAAQPWLQGIKLDLSQLPRNLGASDRTSAGNQTSIDEIRLGNVDPRTPDRYTQLILAAQGAGADGGAVATNRSSDPTLEAPEPGLPYRTTYLGFGLEGVRSDTGTTTRKELLQQILYWTVDQPSVTLAAPAEAVAGQDVAFSASAQSNTPTSFTRYRWDWGDGSPIVTTETPEASHAYAAAGSYTVRVEAQDGWGHTALAASAITVAGTGGVGGAEAPPAATPLLVTREAQAL